MIDDYTKALPARTERNIGSPQEPERSDYPLEKQNLRFPSQRQKKLDFAGKALDYTFIFAKSNPLPHS